MNITRPFYLCFAIVTALLFSTTNATAQWVSGSPDPEWTVGPAGTLAANDTTGGIVNVYEFHLDVEAALLRLENEGVIRFPNRNGTQIIEFQVVYNDHNTVHSSSTTSDEITSFSSKTFSLRDREDNIAAAVFDLSVSPPRFVMSYNWSNASGQLDRRVLHNNPSGGFNNAYMGFDFKADFEDLLPWATAESLPAGRSSCTAASPADISSSHPSHQQQDNSDDNKINLETGQLLRIRSAIAVSPAIMAMIPLHWRWEMMPLVVTTLANAISASESQLVVRLSHAHQILPGDDGGAIDTIPTTGNQSRLAANKIAVDLHHKVMLSSAANNFEIPTGQVWCWGGGGVQWAGTCNNNSSRFRTISRFRRMFDLRSVKTYLHEQCHQFTAPHTFNVNVASQRHSNGAYEPGSGTTLMGYAHYAPETIGTTADGQEILIDHSIEFPELHQRLLNQGKNRNVLLHAILNYHISTVHTIRNFVDGHCPTQVVSQTARIAPIQANYGTQLVTENNVNSNFVPTGKPWMLSIERQANQRYRWHQMDLAYQPSSSLDTLAMEFTNTGPQFHVGMVSEDPKRFFPPRTQIFKDSVEKFHFVMPENGLPQMPVRHYKFGLEIQQETPSTNNHQQHPNYSLTQMEGAAVYVTNLYGGDEFGWQTGPWDNTSIIFSNSQSSSGAPVWEGEVTWKVDQTTESPFNDAEVAIYLVRDENPDILYPLIESTPNDGSANIQIPLTQLQQGRFEPFHVIIKPIDGIYFDVSSRFICHHVGCNSPYALNYDPWVTMPSVNTCDFGPISNINPSADNCKDPASCTFYAQAEIHDPTRCGYNHCSDTTALNAGLSLFNSFCPQAAPCIFDRDECSGAYIVSNLLGDQGFGFSGPLAPNQWRLNGVQHESVNEESAPHKLAFTNFNSRMHLYGHSVSDEGIDEIAASITMPSTGWFSFQWDGLENGWFFYSDFDVLINGQAVELDKGPDYVPCLCYADDYRTSGSQYLEVSAGDEVTFRLKTTSPDFAGDVGIVISNPTFTLLLEPGCMHSDALNYNPSAVCEDISLCVFDPEDPNVRCLDMSACNFNGFALPGQESELYHNPTLCTYPGCLNQAATNYAPFAGCAGPCCFSGQCGQDITEDGQRVGGDFSVDWVEVPDLNLGNSQIDLVYGGFGIPIPTGFADNRRVFTHEHSGETLEKEFTFLYAWNPGSLSPGEGPTLDVLIGETQVMSYGMDTVSGIDLTNGDFPLLNLATPPSLWPGDPFDVVEDAPDGVGLVLSPDVIPGTAQRFFGFRITLPDTACTVRLSIPASPDPQGAYFAMQCISLPEDCGTEAEIAVGCTNPNACNYDMDALADNGSCTLPGCSNPEASNYHPNAGCPSACLYTGTECGTTLTPDSSVAIGFSHAFAPGLSSDNTFHNDSLIAISNWRYLAVGPDIANNDGAEGAVDYAMSWVAQFDGEIQFVWTTASWDADTQYDWPFYAVNGIAVTLNEDMGEPVELGGWMVDAPGWESIGPDILPNTTNGVYPGFEEHLVLAPQLLKTPISISAGDTIALGVHSADNAFGKVVTAFTGLVWSNHCPNLPATDVPGCKEESACNYNFTANMDDGSCTFPGEACDDGDDCTYEDAYNAACTCVGIFVDTDGDGTCDVEDECPNNALLSESGLCGCVSLTDANGNGLPDCIEICTTDLDGDGVCADDDCDDNDPNFPHPFTGNCSLPGPCGCQDPMAQNYAPNASCPGTCLYADDCGHWTVAAQADHPPLGFGFNGPFSVAGVGFTECVENGAPTGSHQVFGSYNQALLLQGPAGNHNEYWVGFRAPVNGTFAFTYAWSGDSDAQPSFELSGPGSEKPLETDSPVWLGPGGTVPSAWYGTATALEGDDYLNQVGAPAYAANQWCGLPASEWISEIAPEEGWRPSSEGWIPTQIMFDSDALTFPNLAIEAASLWPDSELDEKSQAYHRPVVVRMEKGQTLSFHIRRASVGSQGTLAIASPIWTNNCGADLSCTSTAPAGCTYSAACNYTAGAELDDGSCTFPEAGLLCDGTPDPTVSNSCPEDINEDGQIATGDLLLLLGSFGLMCN